ncbi:MAG TPA: RpiB/LacA/LacB family sugar-phosphate isomerase [Candidatus Saccharimonadales bacterium]|nr:RpiB/LacA/LacB family sugar-phosphate isomerase [Candidatus Saccharimonadales bacterium]
MKIYIGADHNGFDLKEKLESFLKRSGHQVVDAGDVKRDPDDDFPQFAGRAVNMLLGDEDEEAKAILICGSGQGMCMAANRFKGVRASLVWNLTEARSARNDDDANVLCLSARSLDDDQAQAIVTTWLATPFAGAPRYKRRLAQLDQLG